MSLIIAVIQARSGSTRLPDKVLLRLIDKSVLEHVVARVKKSRYIKEVVVATTILKEDLRIVKLCASKGIKVYCGSKNDVLDRYYQAARLFGADHVVRITADCPLIDPSVINKVVRVHLESKADYTANVVQYTYPDGEDTEIFTFEALKKAWEKAALSSEREHVTPYIRKHPELFHVKGVKFPQDLSGKRWTLDNAEDYKFIKAVYQKLYKKNYMFGMKEILRFLKMNPHVEKINQHITRNEGYIKSLKEDKVLK